MKTYSWKSRPLFAKSSEESDDEEDGGGKKIRALPPSRSGAVSNEGSKNTPSSIGRDANKNKETQFKCISRKFELHYTCNVCDTR